MKRLIIYNLLVTSLLIFCVFIACNNSAKNKRDNTNADTEQQVYTDEIWKQFLKINVSTMEQMPPDSGSFVILNHKKISYYKFNKLEFSDDLTEYLKNDSLIVYRTVTNPNIQIGYNRKDSVVLLTKGHPEGGNPTGEMEYFAKKVESKTPSPFH